MIDKCRSEGFVLLAREER